MSRELSSLESMLTLCQEDTIDDRESRSRLKEKIRNLERLTDNLLENKGSFAEKPLVQDDKQVAQFVQEVQNTLNSEDARLAIQEKFFVYDDSPSLRRSGQVVGVICAIAESKAKSGHPDAAIELLESGFDIAKLYNDGKTVGVAVCVANELRVLDVLRSADFSGASHLELVRRRLASMRDPESWRLPAERTLDSRLKESWDWWNIEHWVFEKKYTRAMVLLLNYYDALSRSDPQTISSEPLTYCRDEPNEPTLVGLLLARAAVLDRCIAVDITMLGLAAKERYRTVGRYPNVIDELSGFFDNGVIPHNPRTGKPYCYVNAGFEICIWPACMQERKGYGMCL